MTLTAPAHLRATPHFRQRVASRISPDVCADTLAGAILQAIAEDLTDLVRFTCRSYTGAPVYRFHVDGRGTFYAVVSPAKDTVITVIEPGGIIYRGGKRKPKRLRG
ncbi:hypothetical protein JWJ88_17260 [Paracoccus methylovorus]|uniref:Uncharacterized protein n=1 Tax=Paracoccus methylovorus TaxID=2812658 RepID=A0ABX7JN17_9RHOB|nr:hypothetical protein [Paracoccus methylovorus]QRZ14713.1 hypothetical protein JWJ88_17260 [Paracoccus methylovorus]